MGKIESTIKAEIQRLAKHEVKTFFRPLRKEVWGMRLKLSNLLKAFAPMNRLAKEIMESKSNEPKLAASPEEVKASRFTPERIRHLREKLGISQRELGVLIGASTGAVLSWEKGKFKPQGEKKAALVTLRKVKKRDVKKMLEEKAGEKNNDPKAYPHRGPEAGGARSQKVKNKGEKEENAPVTALCVFFNSSRALATCDLGFIGGSLGNNKSGTRCNCD